MNKCFENQERVLSPKPESDMVLEDLEQQVTVINYSFMTFNLSGHILFM